MKRILVFIVFAFLLAAPVLAQESTPEPVTDAPVITEAPAAPLFVLDPNALLIGVLVVSALFIVVSGVNVQTLSKALHTSVPSSVIAGVSVTTEDLLAKTETLVKATPTPIDDAAFDVIKRAVREVLAEPKPLG